MDFSNYGLGRIEPKNFDHVAKYGYGAVMPVQSFTVEKVLPLPKWHMKHNQGAEGACVGFGTSMMLAILNLHQCREQGALDAYIRYNPWWLWDESKKIDPFPETNPGDSNGTLVSTACDILRTVGHVSWVNEDDPKSISEVNPNFGIKENRWASTVDEARTSIFNNIPLSIGVLWKRGFDTPVYVDGEWWIGKDPNALIQHRGGHCVCIYGASDQRQAFRIKNSWGENYPEVWLPYTATEMLMQQGGEFTNVTDK